MKDGNRVLVRIPKYVRSTVAEALTSTIDGALSNGDDIGWSKLQSFAPVMLGVTSHNNDSSISLASIVRSSLLKFDLSFPTWTASSPTIHNVSNMSPTQSLRSLIHRKLSLGDISVAIRVIASVDTILDVTPKVLRALHLKHPGAPADADFPPFPPDINGFSASENGVAKVLRHFAVGSSGGIDGLQPAHQRHLTSNSSSVAGQHLIRSLTALVNRLLNADVPDNTRKLLFSANLTALRNKDGGIIPIAVGNVFRCLHSKVGCAAVTPSLARQLSPTQIGIGVHGACEAAVYTIRRHVINHNENRLIVKLNLKNAFNSVRRDHLLRIARLAHLANSSPSTVLASGHPICSAIGIEQGDPLGPVLLAMAVDEVASSLSSEINIWYLDDATLGGRDESVFVDIRKCVTELKKIGLEVNPSKGEVINKSCPFNEFKQLVTTIASDFADMEHLGSTILDQAVKKVIANKLHTYHLMTHRLLQLDTHTGFFLLNNAFSLPPLLFLFRSSPCYRHSDVLAAYGEYSRKTAKSICNI